MNRDIKVIFTSHVDQKKMVKGEYRYRVKIKNPIEIIEAEDVELDF